MTKYNQKRDERINKKRVKKTGNKARRRFLKRSLEENPEDAQDDTYHFEIGESSKEWNHDPFEGKDWSE